MAKLRGRGAGLVGQGGLFVALWENMAALCIVCIAYSHPFQERQECRQRPLLLVSPHVVARPLNVHELACGVAQQRSHSDVLRSRVPLIILFEDEGRRRDAPASTSESKAGRAAPRAAAGNGSTVAPWAAHLNSSPAAGRTLLRPQLLAFGWC